MSPQLDKYRRPQFLHAPESKRDMFSPRKDVAQVVRARQDAGLLEAQQELLLHSWLPQYHAETSPITNGLPARPHA
jgi:hypothetical protein